MWQVKESFSRSGGLQISLSYRSHPGLRREGCTTHDHHYRPTRFGANSRKEVLIWWNRNSQASVVVWNCWHFSIISIRTTHGDRSCWGGKDIMIRLPTSFSVPRILSSNQAKSGSIFSVLVYASVDELIVSCYHLLFDLRKVMLASPHIRKKSSLPTNSIIDNQKQKSAWLRPNPRAFGRLKPPYDNRWAMKEFCLWTEGGTNMPRYLKEVSTGDVAKTEMNKLEGLIGVL